MQIRYFYTMTYNKVKEINWSDWLNYGKSAESQNIMYLLYNTCKVPV